MLRLRQLWPLLWWTCFVLILLAIHKHQQWIERTRLDFSLHLEGQELPLDTITTLDDLPISSGDRLSLGRHRFVITHPKVEPYSTNLFIWYGEHNLGTIYLKRAKGTLTVRASPRARILSIRGPEFTTIFTNCVGTDLTVPTDQYRVEAEYLHFHETAEVGVLMNTPGSWSFAPRLGTLSLACKRLDSSFQLLKGQTELIEEGKFPYTIEDLPEGNYRLVALHHGNRKNEPISIKPGETNNMDIEFRYGTAVFETTPSGATVFGSDDRDYGTTPITLSELLPGQQKFNLRKEGYEPVGVLLVVTAGETNSFQTNLVSRDYTAAINASREYIVARNYERAVEATLDALRIRPEDAVAKAIQREATGLGSLERAESLGQQGNYAMALLELQTALNALPENEHARSLLVNFKNRQAEEAEKVRVKRLNRPREIFMQRLALSSDSGFFESHELKTNRKASVVSRGILAALRDQAPAFTIGDHSSPEPEVNVIVATRESWSQARICVVVIGQITDEETQILFKVLEYKVDVAGKIFGGLISIGAANGQNKTSGTQADLHTPLHPSKVGPLTDKMKAQIEDGVRITAERIQRAIGESGAKGP